MSTSDGYRRKITRLSGEISRLQKNKAAEAKKVANLQNKVIRAKQRTQRTKSASTARSALREVERHEKSLASCTDKIRKIEEKIARKDKERAAEQKRLMDQETRDQDRRERKQEQRLAGIADSIANHERAIRELKDLPERIIVLFFAANPLDQQQLRLDEEVRAIAEMIRMAKHRDAVKLESCWAVRPLDVLQALNEHQPHIVHFSGHGSNRDEIVFQDEAGQTKLVSKEAIIQTMMASSGDIRLVFFNTCFSRDQAEDVVEHVEAAIGMNTSIGDEAARIFAAQFYSAIGFGLSVRLAFDQAKTALMLENIPEEDTPELFLADGVDSEELVIVRPPDGVPGTDTNK